MKLDAVERELVVCGRHLHSLATAFTALACELRREREGGSLSITRSADADSQALAEIKNRDGAQPLLFPEVS